MGPSDQLIYSSICGSEPEMNIASFVDSHDDNGVEVVDVKPVISDFNSNKWRAQAEVGTINQLQFQKQTEIHQERISNAENTVECGVGTSFHRMPLPDAPSPTSTSSEFSKPLCQNFWKAGAYDPVPSAVNIPRNGQNRLRVHPKFLHSNATAHKWALGAMAELLDNAVDEIHNGATFVSIDKVTNPRDGSPALLIQDDGGGMDPESLRRCMSFGFSEKTLGSSIGQYGNGFKTSTMRLGADVIVFSRCNSKSGTLTQSVGILSYTFLTKVGSDDIVVPMVDYQFDLSGRIKKVFQDEKHFHTNLSSILLWSPFASETELLQQFDDIGCHGTKVIIYNLWHNDDGDMELDFDSDIEDILINVTPSLTKTKSIRKALKEQHIGNQYRHSLRVYSSILYKHLPVDFRIVLRGCTVEHHDLTKDLKFREYILYKPQIGKVEAPSVITTIGFLKEAPEVNTRGFNVYHKNRLILPFWQVFRSENSLGTGVCGVLEANFIEPTHDKQGFEKSYVFQKLESRLKEMTLEYWRYHCHLIGYNPPIRKRPSESVSARPPPLPGSFRKQNPDPHISDGATAGTHSRILPGRPVMTAVNSPVIKTGTSSMMEQTSVKYQTSQSSSHYGVSGSGGQVIHKDAPESSKRHAVVGASMTPAESSMEIQIDNEARNQQKQEITRLTEVQNELLARCAGFENSVKDLLLRVEQLKRENEDAEIMYQKLLLESKSLEVVKLEKL
ncbi:hypothetical protein QJS10_CPB14g00087 [Acorus calamus]|uniref:Morc S5 domain-containing protein n=1 Tax=Acorus calamus TaxID=4465 RepID=A0AAV9DCP4_ACOCL|nr:hypothetical protein QJS10_CPB14g00087 [Acorus calamus]